ncbi:baseplate J/gp47 family protein [Sporosarcina sp. resist]|uniref:baseplate J/gp47 family protein n=1 Tax=Sporosarcina sp. resist TaxID=2762563 RepID=UPI00164E052F|nr:baseplate J/gp47 family protein [Sporosarcina sp. resist]QNK87740.1 baseplate J/gp47 family protein [Sporosarcina sp. resist]
MFEHMTFEYLMEKSLAGVKLDLDKRDSGIIYAGLAANNMELAGIFVWLDTILRLAFAQDSGGEWLEKRAFESGVDKRLAIRAKRRATFNIPLANGERFFVDDLFYRVVEDGVVECEELGVIGNAPPNGSDLLPVSNIDKLKVAILGEVIVPGEEDESDKSLLERYLVERRRKATSANKAHYKKWAEEIEGVGKANVFPLWNGDGTVKIIIVNSEMKPASTELVQAVKDYIDPAPGMGEGEAPIGATLTVESGVDKEITIKADVTLRGNTASEVAAEIAEELQRIFKELSFSGTSIKVATISNVLFQNKWISDYSNVLINDEPINLELEDVEIPYLLAVELND